MTLTPAAIIICFAVVIVLGVVISRWDIITHTRKNDSDKTESDGTKENKVKSGKNGEK